MQYREDTFLSFDKTRIFVRGWAPSAHSRAVVGIIHGSFEHGGRYSPLAMYLAEQGFASYAFDLRGHGKSEGVRVGVSSFDIFKKDIEAFRGHIRRREGDKPMFLLGHSAGASILLSYAISQEPSSLRGIILSAPVIVLGDGISAWSRSLCFMLEKVVPGLRLKPLDAELLCRDKSVVAAYRKDPLVYRGGATVRALAGFMRALAGLRAQLDQVDVPFLILQGENDHFAEPAASRELLSKARSPDKAIRVYPGYYHELLNETDNTKIFEDIAAWLQARSPG